MKPGSRYFELVEEHFGGMNPEAFESFFYWNSPLALKHWTMNVIEILLVAGAVMGLIHAWQVWKRDRDISNIAVWFASVAFFVAMEVPLYFPELFGVDPERVFFIHNEFTAGFIFNQAPAYIVALYPALFYPTWLIVRNAGIFNQRFGLLLGAISAAAIYHVFYAIFDHFGPQYGWWLWDYEFEYLSISLGSVPLANKFGYSMMAPLAFNVSLGLILLPFIKKFAQKGGSLFLLPIVVVVTGFLTPVLMMTLAVHKHIIALVSPNAIQMEAIYYALIASVMLIAVRQFWKRQDVFVWQKGKGTFVHNYLLQFCGLYLITFIGLWLYGLGEYITAVDGWTDRGTPVGSIWYVMMCYVACIYFLKQTHGMSEKGAHTEIGQAVQCEAE